MTIKISKMRKILVILILCQVHLIFAQSKKNQIEQLQFTTDSLNRVIEFERNTNKQKIQELNSAIVNFETKILNQGKSIDSLNSVNRSLNNQLNLKSKELEGTNNKLMELNKINALLQNQIDSLKNYIKKNFGYLNRLPTGYKIADNNGETGEKCTYDYDKDGTEDLLVQLFDEDGIPTLFIFLSSNFYKDKSYQYLDQGGAILANPFLGEFNCGNQFTMSGGFERMGISASIEVNLQYRSDVKIMTVNFIEETTDTDGKTETNRIVENILKIGYITD